MGKAPAFQFYPMDWARDMQEHPLEIEGAWIRICCKLWWCEPRGTATKTYEQWSRILGVSIEKTQSIFKYMNDEHICDICVTDHGKVTVVSRRMSRDERDRRGAAERKRRQREKESSHANVTDASSSSSSSSSSKKEKNTTAQKPKLNGKFDLFWKAYPKKLSKGQAEKAFKSINPDEQLLATMIAMIERAKKSEQWIKDGGQFIPYPATWLRAKGWEDEILTDEERRRARFS